jgi:hypothetical protein
MATEIKLEITGHLDPDASLFVLCMEQASKTNPQSFTELASRTEALVEICENMGCQRVMAEEDCKG